MVSVPEPASCAAEALEAGRELALAGVIAAVAAAAAEAGDWHSPG